MRNKTARRLRQQSAILVRPDVVDYQNDRGEEALFKRVLSQLTTDSHHRLTLEQRIAIPKANQGTIRCHPLSPRGVYRRLKRQTAD